MQGFFECFELKLQPSSYDIKQSPLKIYKKFNMQYNGLNYCSDPTCAERSYIVKWVFFSTEILADQYNYRRDMRLVSLKISTSVKFETSNFFIFLF